MGSSPNKKLGLKPEQRVLVLNCPEGYQESLNSSLEGINLETEPNGIFNSLLLFVKDSSELEQWVSQAAKAVENDGLLWILYPKKSSKVKSDLNRDILWAKMEPFGFAGVSLISLDDTWSAMRFRPVDKVKTARKSK